MFAALFFLSLSTPLDLSTDRSRCAPFARRSHSNQSLSSLIWLTQPLERAARPADDIGINPLESRTQLRAIELAVVVDPAFDVRIVRLGQILQGFVAVTAMLGASANGDRKRNCPGS